MAVAAGHRHQPSARHLGHEHQPGRRYGVFFDLVFMAAFRMAVPATARDTRSGVYGSDRGHQLCLAGWLFDSDPARGHHAYGRHGRTDAGSHRPAGSHLGDRADRSAGMEFGRRALGGLLAVVRRGGDHRLQSARQAAATQPLATKWAPARSVDHRAGAADPVLFSARATDIFLREPGGGAVDRAGHRSAGPGRGRAVAGCPRTRRLSAGRCGLRSGPVVADTGDARGAAICAVASGARWLDLVARGAGYDLAARAAWLAGALAGPGVAAADG